MNKKRQIFPSFFKSSYMMLVISALMACQSEISAQPASDSTLNDSQYTVLASTIPVSTGKKIEVTELFWYGCPGCYGLEPYLKDWKKRMPENVEFVKVPALFRDAWVFHAKAFYTMEALGVLDSANDAFFHRLHVLHKPVSTLNQLSAFLSAYGKSAKEVESAFNSFAVDTKLRYANKITRMSGARAVPAILVDGKYRTNMQLAGGPDKLFDVVDQLIAKAIKER